MYYFFTFTEIFFIIIRIFKVKYQMSIKITSSVTQRLKTSSFKTPSSNK